MGQSENPRHRIGQHIRAMSNNEANTLHYFILSKGRGYRIANFIRLWTMRCPSYADIAVPMILANIMEMFMARAFESLAPGILEKFFGTAKYSGIGLNVVPPLLQGISLSPTTRFSYSLQLEASLDPEIREWPHIREKERRAGPTPGPPTEAPKRLTLEEYQGKLVTAVGDQLGKLVTPFDYWMPLPGRRADNIGSLFDECAMKVKNAVGEERTLVLPTGSMEARIGIVLDHSVNLRTSGRASQKHTVPPWGIEESGFNESNLLIWPFNLQQDTLSGASNQLRPLSDVEEGIFSQFNRELVRASNLRVILLCGPNAVKSIATMDKITLKFRGITFDGYVELADSYIQRVYISSPDPLAHLWANNWRQAQKVAELLRFASLMTDTGGIRTHFYSSALVCVQIIRLYDAERNGQEKMRASTIDPIIREWLYRKGFERDQDIRRLENAGGDLATGLLMLLQVLPDCPAEFRGTGSRRRVPKSKTVSNRKIVLDKAKLNEVSMLYHEKNTPNTTTASSAIEPAFGTMSEHSMTENDQEIDMETASNLLGAVPDKETMEKVKSLAMEKESALQSSADMEDAQVDFYDTADLNEVNELIAASEQDRIECSEISPAAGGGQRISIGGNNLARSKRISKKGVDAAPAHLSTQVVKTQMELLNGRFYRGHWERDTVLLVRVHTVLALKVHTSKANNESGVIVRAEIRPRGEKHPNAWATQAQEDDPAARLGFRITVKDKNKHDCLIYPQTDGEGYLFRANAFVEWMAGDSDEAIANRPRRYVKIPAHYKGYVPDDMRIFVGGAYVDNDGKRRKRLKPDRNASSSEDG